MLSVEAESRSMQLQIEKNTFMSHTFVIAQEQKSKQLEELFSLSSPSVEYRPIKNLFDMHAPTPAPSILDGLLPEEQI